MPVVGPVPILGTTTDVATLAGGYVDMGVGGEGSMTVSLGGGPYIVSKYFGAAGSAGASTGQMIFYLDPAAYVAPAGKTLKLRVRGWTVVNTVAPAITLTVGLYPVTTIAGAGGSAPTAAIGTVVTGSTVAFASPSASTANAAVSTDFAFPTAGFYAVGVALSGAGTASSIVLGGGRLQRVFS
jgi:hypothetical protein